jgi:hypothetical protein
MTRQKGFEMHPLLIEFLKGLGEGLLGAIGL